MHGKLIGHARSSFYTPEVELALAVLFQAIADARGGDHTAAAWLAGEGRLWADLVGVAPELLARWHEGGTTGGRRAMSAGEQIAAQHRRAAAWRERKRMMRNLAMPVTIRTHVRDARGFVMELTLDGPTGAEVVQTIDGTITALLKRGFEPVNPFAEPRAAEIARNLAQDRASRTATAARPAKGA